MVHNSKKILITFDVEEFDTPLRHGINISLEDQLRLGAQGLYDIADAFDQLSFVKATFYTTAFFAQHYHDLIRRLSDNHEIASHTFYHTRFSTEDIANSKIELEKITGKNIYGFRMPNLQNFDKKLLVDAGYLYDSSFCPTWIPGRYNYLHKSIYPVIEEGILQIPASATPIFRIPLFWLSFKNFPFHVYVAMCKHTLARTGFLNLYFHPWEFSDLTNINIPNYVKRIHGKELTERLVRLINVLSEDKRNSFVTTFEFAKNYI
jgi:peptidoglycan/xylan/chitin deacetylase (PgdA/CDA1 family)